jgi:AhpD family alkylhydroperoxidase
MASARVALIETGDAPILARPFFRDEAEASPILRALAQVPELVPVTMPFIARVLGPGFLDLRAKELIILRVSAKAGCVYCVGAHRVAACDAGVTGPESEALLGRRSLDEVFAPPAAALVRLADAVASLGEVADRDTRPVRRAYGDHGLVEAVTVAATTLMLNRFCTTLRLPLSPTTRARLAELDQAPAT